MRNRRSFKHLNLLLLPVVVIFTFVLLGCNSKTNDRTKMPAENTEKAVSEEVQISIPDSITEFLLNSAATDFHSGRISKPLRFREVKMGFLMLPNQDRQYVLCGQFLEQQNGVENQWMPFATVKTEPYEHWIGRQAGTFCDDPELRIQNDTDLSSALKSKLDAL